ncbi:MAG: site-specific integrase [Oscillospiraceae bacterium]|nr:site-specific integrase [Oscillospiraceae bacterium]
MKTKRGLPDMTWIPDKKLWRKRGTYKSHKYSLTAKTPEEVLAKIEEFKARIDKDLIVDENITVSEYAMRWLPLRVAGLKSRSADVYFYSLQRHILPKIGQLQLKAVKPLNIDELMAEISGMSSSLNSKVLLTLNQLFRSAIDNDIISKNPCSGRKPCGAPTRVKTPLTREQQETLTEAVRETRAELFTLLCLYAGLRREEALGLLWGNVHLEGTPYIDVRHTVIYESGRTVHDESLKSKSAYRSIPIPPQLTEALLRWRGRAQSMFVVPAVRTNRAMSETALKRLWDIVTGYTYRRKVKSDGSTAAYTEKRYPGLVDFPVQPHLLRHTYITELCASGMDIKKIQYLAGHSTVQMTLNVYAHVKQNKPEQLAPDVIKAFSGTLTRTLPLSHDR